jgi:hypothetical protein
MSKIIAIACLVALAAMLAGCGGSASSSDSQMVWCVAPGEVVDAQFKQEYPDLYMPKVACDAVNR